MPNPPNYPRFGFGQKLLSAQTARQPHNLKVVSENDEQLAVFDLLLKPELTKSDIRKIKSVAVGLLKELERQMRDVQDIFGKTSTRDRLRQSISYSSPA